MLQCAGGKVVYITTASKFEKVNFYVKADRNALSKLGFNSDCIFVEGGKTFFLLQELKRPGEDKMILEHI